MVSRTTTLRGSPPAYQRTRSMSVVRGANVQYARGRGRQMHSIPTSPARYAVLAR